jgi:tetratricopeptide (TPR) repeat protein
VVLLLLLGVAVVAGLVLVFGPRGSGRDEAVALNNQGFAALQAGHRPAARRFLVDAVRRDPDYAPAQINLARVQLGDGAPDSASRRLQELLRRLRGRSAEVRQQRGYARSVLGDIAVADGNWTSAVSNYRQAFAEDSSEARAYNQLGWALLHAGLGAEARDVLARGQARFPTEKALHKNAALADLALGDARAAEQNAARALALDSEYAAAHAAMARVHARMGRRDEALIEWNAFLRHPHDPADSVAAAAELARVGFPR